MAPDSTNGILARLVRAEQDIQSLFNDKARKDDVRRLEEGIDEIRSDVKVLRQEWQKANEIAPWTRSQKLIALGIAMAFLASVATMVITILTAT